MGTTLRAVFVALALMLAGVGSAWADTCFNDSFGNVLVGKSFVLPGPGACHAFNGYFMNQLYTASGNVCRASTGSPFPLIIFNLVAAGATSNIKLYTFNIDARSLGGGGSDCSLGGSCSPFNIDKLAVCPSSRPFGG